MSARSYCMCMLCNIGSVTFLWPLISVRRVVSHSFLEEREISLPCSYRSTCFDDMYLLLFNIIFNLHHKLLEITIVTSIEGHYIYNAAALTIPILCGYKKIINFQPVTCSCQPVTVPIDRDFGGVMPFGGCSTHFETLSAQDLQILQPLSA